MQLRTQVLLLTAAVVFTTPAWSESPLNQSTDDSQGQHPAAIYPNGANDTGQQPGGAAQSPLSPEAGRQGVEKGSPQVLDPNKEQPAANTTDGKGVDNPPTRHQAP